MVYDIWLMAHGLLLMVPGSWFMVGGVWIDSLWSMVYGVCV